MSQFDVIVNRRGSYSYKWDEAANGILPMWVADMDFTVAPPIIETLRKRVEHGIFGYSFVPDAYYEALIGWFERRHHWHIDRESVIYTSGVVPAISAILQAICQHGDRVLVQTPVYNCFFSSIRNSGCELADAPLKLCNGRYEIDFDRFEAEAAHERCRVFLLCNPHNPAGRVWTASELRRLGDICLRHNVVVISDEIHCELTLPGKQFTPYATLGEKYAQQAVVCNSPSKAFNIAGLQIANIICTTPTLRQRIDRAININEVCDVNPFGILALIAAYNESESWLDELREYIAQNYHRVCEVFASELPDYPLVEMEGTYLPWFDISASGMTAQALCQYLTTEHQVWLNPGEMYGTEGFVRINIACPRTTLDEGLHRIVRGLRNLKQ